MGGRAKGGGNGGGLDDQTIKLIKENLPALPVLVEKIEKMNNEFKELDGWKRAIEERMGLLQGELKDIQTKLNGIDQALEELQDSVLDKERHSRSWNIIIPTKEKEERGEDAEGMVREILGRVKEVDQRKIEFDIVHRVGGRHPGKERPFLARMLKKSDTRFLLSGDIRRKFRDLGVAILADLPYADRMEKKKYQAEINKLCQGGARAKFERGKWFVNGQRFKTNTN